MFFHLSSYLQEKLIVYMQIYFCSTAAWLFVCKSRLFATELCDMHTCSQVGQTQLLWRR